MTASDNRVVESYEHDVFGQREVYRQGYEVEAAPRCLPTVREPCGSAPAYELSREDETSATSEETALTALRGIFLEK